MALAAAPPRAPDAERKETSNRAALAVLGNRFPGKVKEALAHSDFTGATRHYTDAALKEMRAQPEAVAAAIAAEEERRAEAEAAEADCAATFDLQRKYVCGLALQ